jgi:nicotinate-nucleotide pyrophosphorylase (carboxylating)
VKENHIVAAGGLERVIERLGNGIEKAEIEVSSIEELEKLASKPPWRIMLDNFTPEMVSLAIDEIEKWARRPEIEVSGSVTVDTISLYAIEGVDCISIGSLTSSAPSADMSMLIEKVS